MTEDNVVLAEASRTPQKLTLEPAYYYGDADPSFGIPVFTPSWEEFRDFEQVIHAVFSYGKRASIVKIIPPKEWYERLGDWKQRLEKVTIHPAIEQEFAGSSGAFRQDNIEIRKKFSVKKFATLARSAEHRTPSGENAVMNRTPSSAKKRKMMHEEHKVSNADEKRNGSVQDVDEKMSHGQDDVITANEINVDEFHFPEEDEDWSEERCQDLERLYWKSLLFNRPIYGADLAGSLFSPTVNAWNVANLGDLLQTRLKRKLPGVNMPYLYFGMWKATFAWHVEDMNLFSINYIHGGAPKQWYAIPEEDRARFERLAKEHSKCPEFLRHKQCHFSPNYLSQNMIRVGKMVQKAGEIVITFPRGYHAGYNLGFNIAESINFAFEEWFPYAKEAGHCQCQGDSVRIDYRVISGEITEKQSMLEDKLRNGEPKKGRKPSSSRPGWTYSDLWLNHRNEKECILCNYRGVGAGLLRAPVHVSPEMPGAKVLPRIWAHKLCAIMVPETWIREETMWVELSTRVSPKKDASTADLVVEESPPEEVIGMGSVPYDRWKLKCSICFEFNRGAPIQCGYGKCTKAFHVTCAQQSGMCTRRPQGDTYAFEAYCPQHDPVIRRIKEAEQAKQLEEMETWMAVNSPIVTDVNGQSMTGVVISVNSEQKMCAVEFPGGYVKHLHWSRVRPFIADFVE